MKRLFLTLSLSFLSCLGPEDVPTKVVDLRVLGLSVEPPELMTPVCDDSVAGTALWASPVQYTALVVDPKGEGRDIVWELFACAWPGNRTCSNEEERVLLQQGNMSPGELRLTIQPGLSTLPSGTPLISRVLELDTFAGLGGIRMPLVLHVRAGEEEVFAQKLMVFSCRLFPEMNQNVSPVLPGLLLNDSPWDENDLPVLKGRGPWNIKTQDFAALQEPYTVPSFELQPIQLQESWKVSWHADSGLLSLEETGGTDFGGTPGLHELNWQPSRLDLVEKNVTLWAVVRDGRGGSSWLRRQFRYQP